MPSATFSRSAWPASTSAYTQRIVARGAAVQQVAERQQRRRLARLPRGVEHEVALVANETEQLVQIHAVERRDAVVVVRTNGAHGVEEAHERVVATARAVPGRRHGVIAHGGGTGVVRGDFDTGVSTGCTAGDAQRASVLHWPACRSR
ncbi:MAG: hypothetical protein J4G16_13990 [Acidobacteria bacterium]|nr:hypothetical protein [Acidobacteriota bacterium]